MVDALAVAALVVLVNGACILTFDRAQRALRDLGAAWVRALAEPSTAAPLAPEPHDAEPPAAEPAPLLRPALARVPL